MFKGNIEFEIKNNIKKPTDLKMVMLRHFDACEEKQQIKTKHTNSININLLMHLNLVIQYFDIDK